VSKENAFGSVLVEDAGEYFVLERPDAQSTEDCKAGFAIVIVLDGKSILKSQHGKPMTLDKGETVVVPYSVGAIQFSGVGDILVVRPPLAT
jgi:mannose-6-phosphate isomerase